MEIPICLRPLRSGDLHLLVLDNLLTVFHSTLDVLLLYDIKPALSTAGDACTSEGFEVLHTVASGARQPLAKVEGSKMNKGTTVRALGPLIGGSPLAMGPPQTFKDTRSKEPNSDNYTQGELETAEFKREALGEHS